MIATSHELSHLSGKESARLAWRCQRCVFRLALAGTNESDPEKLATYRLLLPAAALSALLLWATIISSLLFTCTRIRTLLRTIVGVRVLVSSLLIMSVCSARRIPTKNQSNISKIIHIRQAIQLGIVLGHHQNRMCP